MVRTYWTDRLAQNNTAGADGLLDFMDGITIDNTKGKLIFPVIEPFGKDLEGLFTSAEQSLRDKYTFPEMYQLTQAEAKQKYSNKDRYTLKGTVQSSNTAEFQLGVFDLKPNSLDFTVNRFYNVRLFYNSNAVRPYTSQSFAASYTFFGFSLKLLFQ